MTKAETISFIKKIKAYYPVFKLEEEGVDEWASRLKPYSKDDILRKFEEHLKGEYALEPPKLHFLTKFLKTEEEKERYGIRMIWIQAFLLRKKTIVFLLHWMKWQRKSLYRYPSTKAIRCI